ncbi:MAG: hypothetical protein K0R90_538 [Oscillospiraceae bacterium]|nr:hypothetical protein [Oscillospiraceae bacterium]
MKKSYKVSIGGTVASLSLLLMFLTSIFPFANYALPAIAGLLLIVIVVEINKKYALVVYLAVSLLSVVIVPMKEPAFLYAAFFGYYAILKSVLEQLKNRAVEWTLKLLVFNVSMASVYLLMIYLFRISEVINDFNDTAKYSLVVFWIAANGVFIVYDIALSRMIGTYINWFRPKYLKKFH